MCLCGCISEKGHGTYFFHITVLPPHLRHSPHTCRVSVGVICKIRLLLLLPPVLLLRRRLAPCSPSRAGWGKSLCAAHFPWGSYRDYTTAAGKDSFCFSYFPFVVVPSITRIYCSICCHCSEVMRCLSHICWGHVEHIIRGFTAATRRQETTAN